MANFKSDQRTNETASPVVPVKAYEGGHGGRKRVLSWTYTTPAASMPTVADTIELVKMPAGAKILRIKTANEAMSTAGGTAGFDLGYAGATQRYGAAIDVDAAGEDITAHTIALNYGDVLSAEKILLATVTGEQWAASKKFYGEVEYTID